MARAGASAPTVSLATSSRGCTSVRHLRRFGGAGTLLRQVRVVQGFALGGDARVAPAARVQSETGRLQSGPSPWEPRACLRGNTQSAQRTLWWSNTLWSGPRAAWKHAAHGFCREGTRSQSSVRRWLWVTATREGNASQGWRCGTRFPLVGGANVVNPMAGSRVQQTCKVRGGANRRGREKRRGWNMCGTWLCRTEGILWIAWS